MTAGEESEVRNEVTTEGGRRGVHQATAATSFALLVVFSAALIFTGHGGAIGSPQMVALVGLAYVATTRANVRLVVRDIHLNYVPTEFALLLGVLVLPPVSHVVVRMVASAVATVWRVHRRRLPTANYAIANAFLGGADVAIFTATLALLGWDQRLSSNGPTLIAVAWVALQLAQPIAVVVGRLWNRSTVDWAAEKRGVQLSVVLSFGTMICALIFALGFEDHNDYLLPLFAILLVSAIAPFRYVMALFVKADEFRSLDEFFTLLQTTDSTNVNEALQLAAKSSGAKSAQLVILEREGLNQNLDSALTISIGSQVSSNIEDLPGLWQEALRTSKIRVQARRRTTSRSGTAQSLHDEQSQIVCPLILKGNPVGLLVCSDQRDDRVTMISVSMATRLAQQLSMWLEQDRLLGELRREMVERTREALQDPLTGLLNRRGFNESWNDTLDRGFGHLAVLLIDLDRFKDVNTHLGHSGGDELLVQVAERLRRIAPAGSSIARLGGDEFSVVVPVMIPGKQAEKDALSFGKAVRRALGSEHVIEGETIAVGGSVGVALYPEHGDNLNTLLYNADAAMFAAKDDPENGVVAHADTAINSGSSVADAYRLKTAIENRDIKVWYQPIVDMHTYQVAGFEALARWQDGMSVVLPSEFISLAERSGHIHALTELVMNDAFSNMVRWRSQTGLNLHVAVNFSPLSISHPHSLKAISETLEWTGLPPDAVHIEVTESRMFRDPERAIVHLDELKRRGLKISLDDFGTGHSTHEWLMRMAPNEIKIDRMFIRDIHDPRAAGIVEVDVLLASKFDMTVVAEGIETTEQWERARDLGVTYGQGFLLGRPMPVEKVNRWLVEEHLQLKKLVRSQGLATTSARS
jgi:diguanylate cyclase (GGDEF)-like protein